MKSVPISSPGFDPEDPGPAGGENPYEDLCTRAPIAYQALDEDGRLLVVNERWLEILRYKRADVVGLPFADILPGELRERFRTEIFPQFKASNAVSGLETEVIRGDGVRRLVSIEGRVARNPDGSFRRTHCVFMDVTEERSREDQLRQALLQAEMANKTKSLFLANMSHELRTPLNAIIGFSEMMSEAMMGPLSPTYAEYARIIRDSGRHLHRIINDVLDMSRVEAGAMVLEREEVAIGDLIDEALDLVRLQASAAGVRIVRRYARHVLQVDRLRIKQVLLNILSNAIKFSHGGTVTIRTACTPPIHRIVISDTGIGMTGAEMARALIPFGHADGDLRVRTYDGVGLGLPLARRFVEMHGGTLEISSRKGEGTTVTVSIPEHVPAGPPVVA